jgi:transketolase C-terminal domain/subunit
MNLYLINDNDVAATYGIGTYLRQLTHVLESTGINVRIVHLHSVRPEFEIVVRQARQPMALKEAIIASAIENWYIPGAHTGNTLSGSIQEIEDYCRNVIYLL